MNTSRRLSVAVIAAASLMLAACSADGGQGGSASDSAPACDDVWVDGATLPAAYDGCLEDQGVMTRRAMYDCEDGSVFTTYDDRFFGTLGGAIGAGPKTSDGSADSDLEAAFAAAFDNCTPSPEESVHRNRPGRALKAAVENAGLHWADDITRYFPYSDNTVIVSVSSDSGISSSDAEAMCADLVAFAGTGDLPADLLVWVEDSSDTDLAKC